MTGQPSSEKPPLVWALLDPRVGTANQVLGVAEALGFPYDAKPLAYSRLSALPLHLLPPSLTGLAAESRTLLRPPWPDIILSAGRRALPAARRIKARTKGRAFLCHLMWPGFAPEDVDLLAVPAHDRIRFAHPNVLITPTVPHRLTPGNLTAAAADPAWQALMGGGPLPERHIALLVGGDTKKGAFTADDARRLAQQTQELVAALDAPFILAAASRRTSPDALKILENALPSPHRVFPWRPEAFNPYPALLGHASAIVVTGDSTSMCSEATVTGRPVYIFEESAAISAKHRRLHRALYAEGFARPLRPPYEVWSYSPESSAELVANMIRRMVYGQH